jgi:hypothetical protein
MACCVAMAAIFGAALSLKAALFGRGRGRAQEWRLKDDERI